MFVLVKNCRESRRCELATVQSRVQIQQKIYGSSHFCLVAELLSEEWRRMSEEVEESEVVCRVHLRKCERCGHLGQGDLLDVLYPS